MSTASGRYLLIAALVCGAFVAVLVWNLRPRAALERARSAEGTSARVTSPQASASAAAAVAGPASATQSATAAPEAVISNPPESATAGSEQARPPLEARQLAKIARGMRPNPEGSGILVEATPPGSVVGQMRLQPGDVILTVDGVPVTTPEQFARTYRERGLPQQLTILRGGTEVHLH
jgi:S1-C subfamily serine protease